MTYEALGAILFIMGLVLAEDSRSGTGVHSRGSSTTEYLVYQGIVKVGIKTLQVPGLVFFNACVWKKIQHFVL